MRISLGFCLLLFLTAHLPAQSPWVRSRAGFYAQLGYHFIPAYGESFDAKGEILDLKRKISEGTLQFYGEYGLNKRLTFVAAVPFRFIAATERQGNQNETALPAAKISAFGNISIAARYQASKGRLPLTLTLRVDAPAGQFDAASGLTTGFDALTIMPMLSTGIGFRKVYAFVYAGYGLRNNDYSHVLNAGVEAGVNIRKFWLIGFSELVQPMRNGAVSLPVSQNLNSLYVNNQQYLSTGLKLIYQPGRFWGVILSGAGAATAQLLPRSPGIGLGVFFRWD